MVLLTTSSPDASLVAAKPHHINVNLHCLFFFFFLNFSIYWNQFSCGGIQDSRREPSTDARAKGARGATQDTEGGRREVSVLVCFLSILSSQKVNILFIIYIQFIPQAEKRRRETFRGRGSTHTPGRGKEAGRGKEN